MFSRKMLTIPILVIGVVFAVSIFVGLPGAVASEDSECNLYGCDDDCEFTTDFQLNKCRFVSWGNNPYFKLWPGYQLVLEGEEEPEVEGEEGEDVRVVITVLWETEMIDLRKEGIGRVRTRVVEEREWVDGELAEVSRNFFARCRQTDAVYYFGEDVDNYEDGEIDNHDGAWRAGENGAMPGLIMPGTFLLGSKYFQEIAEDDEAVDRGENTAMGLTVKTDAGKFKNCVEVVDTNPAEDVCGTGELDEGDEKIYCPGVGLVVDEELELVDYGFYIFDLNDDDE